MTKSEILLTRCQSIFEELKVIEDDYDAGDLNEDEYYLRDLELRGELRGIMHELDLLDLTQSPIQEWELPKPLEISWDEIEAEEDASADEE